jgi:hypothetical protein
MDAERLTVLAPMSADEAHATEAAIIKIGDQLRTHLVAFYERQGYRALGYASYTAWAEAIAPRVFGVTHTRLTRELTAAVIERELLPMGNNSPIPERQLRPMAALVERPRGPLSDTKPIVANGAAIRETWEAAQQIAQERDERFGARHVQQAVSTYLEEKTEDMTDRPTRFTTGMRSSDSDAWFTPAKILAPVRAVLGEIDLDPCSNDIAQQDVQARRYYTEADDGLRQPWDATTIFMNPPYGRSIGAWTERLIGAYTSGVVRAALALLPGRTDTDWFTPLFAYPICFVHGRLTFSGYTAGAPFPSVVVYFGADLARFAHAFAPLGPIMQPLRDELHRSAYTPNDIRTPGHAARTLVTA